MITNLTIRNFQRHEALDLDLSPGVNVIMGRSGTGKSSIIRALRWLVANRPLGESYRRWDSQETSVDVVTSEGNVITRLKSSKDNLYRLNDRETFRSFGQNPPEAIAKALNLGAINFQSQHDPLFLLSMSEAELSKVLNEVAGLDDIDRSRGRVNVLMTRGRLQAQSAKALRDRLREEVAAYEGLDELEVGCRVLDSLAEQETGERVRANTLSDMSNRLAGAISSLEGYKGLPKAQDSLKSVLGALNEVSELEAQSDGLYGLADRLDGLKGEAALYREVDRTMKAVDALQAKVEEWQGLETMADSIDWGASAIGNRRSKLSDIDREYDALHQEFEQLMPEECPLCGNVRPR